MWLVQMPRHIKLAANTYLAVMKRDAVAVVVDVSDYRSMQTKAKEAVRELARFGAGDDELSLYHSDGNTRVYQRRVEGSGQGEVTATGTMALSIDALAYALYNATSNDHRTFLALHYGADYLEGRVINKSVTRTNDPFLWLGAKYKKMYLPGTTLFEPRDATYLEYSATFMDDDGQRRVLLLQSSKAFPTMPAVPEVVRFSFTLMHMFTEVEPGRVEFVSRYCLGDVGKVPSYLVRKMLLHELLLDPHLLQLVQKRRLLDSSFLSGNGGAMPAVPKIGKCTTCGAKFGPFRSVTHCAACGQGMCKPCRVLVYRAVHVKSVSPVIKLCFCKGCSIDARLARSAAPPPRVPSSTSSPSVGRGFDTTNRSTPIQLDDPRQPLHQHNVVKGSSARPTLSQSSSSSGHSTQHVTPRFRWDEAPTAATEAMDGWMGEAPSEAPSTTEAMELLHHMQTSLEDQKMLLHMMRMRLASHHGAKPPSETTYIMAPASSISDDPAQENVELS